MKYNRCGNSGLLLPAISLGLWQNFGDNSPRSHSFSLLKTAFDSGITHFDLANNYGPPPGSSETRIGEILQHEMSGLRDELIISTKAGHQMWTGPYGELGSRKHLIASLDQSLKRLQLDYVDIFYHHCPDSHTPLEETMGALADIVKQGKAIYVGISKYTPENTARAAALLEQLNTRCLIHQSSYSMLNRKPEQGLLQELGKRKIGCIAFSPLAQGRLTNRYLSGIPNNSRVTHSVFLKESNITPEYLQAAKELNDLALKRGQSFAQMSVAWVLRHPEITSALIGASQPQQIIDNVQSLEKANFSQEELGVIDNILKKYFHEEP